MGVLTTGVSYAQLSQFAVPTPRAHARARSFAALRMTQKKMGSELGIRTLTRRIEYAASASPCQGEAIRRGNCCDGGYAICLVYICMSK
jgi:hypothetical protein